VATPAQAGCTIWRALTHQSDEHLRDLVLQFSEGGGFELAHLGVVDSIRGAESCELSTAYAEFSIECELPSASEADPVERLETMLGEAETCLAARFEPRPDRAYADTNSAFLHQRNLTIEYEDVLDVDIEFQIRRYNGTYGVVFRVEREAW
jgi:hypothetical protein